MCADRGGALKAELMPAAFVSRFGCFPFVSRFGRFVSRFGRFLLRLCESSSTVIQVLVRTRLGVRRQQSARRYVTANTFSNSWFPLNWWKIEEDPIF